MVASLPRFLRCRRYWRRKFTFTGRRNFHRPFGAIVALRATVRLRRTRLRRLSPFGRRGPSARRRFAANCNIVPFGHCRFAATRLRRNAPFGRAAPHLPFGQDCASRRSAFGASKHSALRALPLRGNAPSAQRALRAQPLLTCPSGRTALRADAPSAHCRSSLDLRSRLRFAQPAALRVPSVLRTDTKDSMVAVHLTFGQEAPSAHFAAFLGFLAKSGQWSAICQK